MKKWIVSDTHLNHNNIETYCKRPHDFTELYIRNHQTMVSPDDLVIHTGDVYIDKHDGWDAIWPTLPGRKVLVRGNHDLHHPCTWWMQHGFDFACDSMTLDHIYFTHRPAAYLPSHCEVNVHGHLHNIWHGFHRNEPETETFFNRGKLRNPWQRLFALEYTDYKPVELTKFLGEPDKYLARGPVLKRETELAVKVEGERKAIASEIRRQQWVAAGCPKRGR